MNCPKQAIKNVFNLIRKDCQSVTGSNLRKIMLLVQKTNVDDLVPEDALNVIYHEIPDCEMWRIGFVNEITDVKFGQASIDGFTRQELNVILEDICTSWQTVTKWLKIACNVFLVRGGGQYFYIGENSHPG